MERKLLLVFALTFLVIMVFQPLLKRYGPQPAAKPESSQPAPQNQAQSQTPAQPATQVSAAPAGITPPAAAPQQAATESETVIENDLYRIVFTNRGGRVKSWVLKKYTDDKGGQLELVNSTAAEKYGYPLTLWTYDETLRNKVNSALYVALPTLPQSARKDGATALKDGAPALNEIKYAFDDGDVLVQKSFTFDRSSYVIGVKTAVYVKGVQVTAFPMWPAGFGDQSGGPSYAASQIAYQNDGKVERLAAGWTLFPAIKIIGGNTVL